MTSSAGTGACLFYRIIQSNRERHEVKRPGYSFERPGRRAFRWTTLRLELSPFFGVFVQTGTKYPYCL